MLRIGSKFRLFFCAALLIAAFSKASAQEAAKRPHITGISHVGYFVSDLPKALVFWHDFLGYDESYTLPKPDGTGTRIAFVKLNDHQHIELFTDPPTYPHNMMSHLCFAVDDIEQMRLYLRSKGYDVKPVTTKTKTGDYAFEIKDPNGMLIEFVQTLPDGWEARAAGKFLPETRISPRIYHAGYKVDDTQKTMDFYTMLGFTETWRGGADPKELSWINMKVPDGSDYVELMLNHGPTDWSTWGSKNHLSLAVSDIEKARKILQARPSYNKPLEIKTGVNQKRQMNMFDPDGTRVELMEPYTITGNPTPSSTAPPPPPSLPPNN